MSKLGHLFVSLVIASLILVLCGGIMFWAYFSPNAPQPSVLCATGAMVFWFGLKLLGVLILVGLIVGQWMIGGFFLTAFLNPKAKPEPKAKSKSRSRRTNKP